MSEKEAFGQDPKVRGHNRPETEEEDGTQRDRLSDKNAGESNLIGWYRIWKLLCTRKGSRRRNIRRS